MAAYCFFTSVIVIVTVLFFIIYLEILSETWKYRKYFMTLNQTDIKRSEIKRVTMYPNNDSGKRENIITI